MFNMGRNKDYIMLYTQKIIICTISIIFLGIAISFNTNAMLGSDPVAVFYNGLGKFTGISMGIAANIINCILAMIVFLINRKYIHIGTIIYAIVLGQAINFGFFIQTLFIMPYSFLARFLTSLMAYGVSFVSLGAFMSIDIGIDPWTALSVIISKKINKSFRFTKILIDAVTFIFGYVMGGIGGLMTLFAVFAGGPSIQKVSEFLDKVFSKVLKYNSISDK